MQRHFMLIAVLLVHFVCEGQDVRSTAHYDEGRVPSYVLPDLLRCSDGTEVATARQWERRRRPEIEELLRREMYGRLDGKARCRCEVVEQGEALGGKALRRQVRMVFTRHGRTHTAMLLVYTPAGKRKVPAFFGYNFFGNHTVSDDRNITVRDGYAINDKRRYVYHNNSNEAARGALSYRWPLERIIGAGYGLVTLCCNDIFPDHPEGHSESVLSMFPEVGEGGDAPQAIAAWAWGASRVLDVLERDEYIDGSRVIIFGHSRLGKTALWAAACDRRFAAVISNESGCGGMALSRRAFGETVLIITTNFPHWFNRNFSLYSRREAEMPFDQHYLAALVAPRPLHIASASDDRWSDPRGEYLGGKAASPVYELYGLGGMGVEEPKADGPSVGGSVSYHIRSGRHEVMLSDWEHYISFADRWLRH